LLEERKEEGGDLLRREVRCRWRERKMGESRCRDVRIWMVSAKWSCSYEIEYVKYKADQ